MEASLCRSWQLLGTFVFVLLPMGALGSCDDPPMTDRITQRSFSFSSEEPSTEYPVGSVFTYTCRPGYEFSPGENKFTITCQSNFQWSEDPSPCRRVSCPTPHIDHGTVVLSSRQQELYATRDEGRKYLYDDIIRIQCNPGYGFHGDNVILCDQSGNWSPAIPQCVRGGCDNPPVTNKTMQRSFSFSSEEPSTEFPVGSVFTYTCRPGYEFRPGENKLTVTCQSNFQWSEDPSLCRRVSCPTPHIDHGTVVLSSWLRGLYATRDVGRKFLYDDTIRIQCNPGYGFHGDDSIRCNQSGSWSPAIPQCVRACGPPPDIKRGQHSGGTKEHFFYGSEVKYSCAEGLSLIGESSIYCTSGEDLNMIWSGPAPRCAMVPCSRPVIQNGRMTTTRYGFRHGTTVQFSCNAGYVMDGSRESQCQEGGIWDPPVPSCRWGKAQ